MQPDEYRKMAKAESVMWWYRALHANLLWLIRRFAPVDGPILDAGCGTGGLLARLASDCNAPFVRQPPFAGRAVSPLARRGTNAGPSNWVRFKRGPCKRRTTHARG